MPSYRKKPVEIEASQWFKLGDHPSVEPYADQLGVVKGIGPYGWITTLEGGHIVSPGDWIIRGIKGELYPCKPDIFAATYDESPSTAMSFSAALAIVKAGGRVARAGWNGKGMFIYLNKGSFPHELLGFEAGATPVAGHPSTIDGVSLGLFECGDRGTAIRLPNINMRSASGAIVTGWLASQTDILAEDWEVV